MKDFPLNIIETIVNQFSLEDKLTFDSIFNKKSSMTLPTYLTPGPEKKGISEVLEKVISLQNIKVFNFINLNIYSNKKE